MIIKNKDEIEKNVQQLVSNGVLPPDPKLSIPLNKDIPKNVSVVVSSININGIRTIVGITSV